MVTVPPGSTAPAPPFGKGRGRRRPSIVVQAMEMIGGIETIYTNPSCLGEAAERFSVTHFKFVWVLWMSFVTHGYPLTPKGSVTK